MDERRRREDLAAIRKYFAAYGYIDPCAEGDIDVIDDAMRSAMHRFLRLHMDYEDGKLSLPFEVEFVSRKEIDVFDPKVLEELSAFLSPDKKTTPSDGNAPQNPSDIIVTLVREYTKIERCGHSDPSRAGAVGIAPWDKNHLKYSFGEISSLNGASGIVLLESDIKAAIRRAISTFEASGARLTFDEVAPDQTHDIFIETTSPSSDWDNFSWKRFDVAHANYPPEHGAHFSCTDNPDEKCLPLPIHFRIDKLWGLEDNSREWYYDVESVALHEIGHTLGLIHCPECGISRSIMYGGMLSQPRARIRRDLFEFDVDNIRALYP